MSGHKQTARRGVELGIVLLFSTLILSAGLIQISRNKTAAHNADLVTYRALQAGCKRGNLVRSQIHANAINIHVLLVGGAKKAFDPQLRKILAARIASAQNVIEHSGPVDCKAAFPKP